MPTILGPSYAILGEGGSALNLLNAEDSGVEWLLEDIQGWGSPASTITSTQRPAGHGSWSGPAYLGPRSIGVTGRVRSANPVLLSDALDRLMSAVSLDTTKLTVVEGGRSRFCWVRRAPTEVSFTATSAEAAQWSFQLVADDPRKYGPALTVSTALPSSSGGVTWPVTWPMVWTGVTATGAVSILNSGNVSSPLTVRFDGPVTGPKVVHSQTGLVWAAAGAVIGAGEFWTVDMARRQVLAQGQVSRSGFVTSRGWMEALPGQNDYQFAADVFDAGSLMTVTASPAWK